MKEGKGELLSILEGVMVADGDNWLRRVAEVEDYLRRNPLACDTLEGIARWWVGDEADVDDIEAALNWMERHGLVERVVAADGRVRFRRAPTP
jgi:hypothetical protein